MLLPPRFSYVTQMEVLLMSRGGFSISAANRGLPRRAMVLKHDRNKENTCVM